MYNYFYKELNRVVLKQKKTIMRIFCKCIELFTCKKKLDTSPFITEHFDNLIILKIKFCLTKSIILKYILLYYFINSNLFSFDTKI